jgi:hypothetical protein
VPREPPASSAARAATLDALKPSGDMMAAVMANPALMRGFDDPDVMAAVAEVAADPAAFAKHAHKPGVRAFYAAMAGVAGDKLTRVGEEKARGGAGSSGNGSGGGANANADADAHVKPAQQQRERVASPAAAPPPPPRCTITELD